MSTLQYQFAFKNINWMRRKGTWDDKNDKKAGKLKVNKVKGLYNIYYIIKRQVWYLFSTNPFTNEEFHRSFMYKSW